MRIRIWISSSVLGLVLTGSVSTAQDRACTPPVVVGTPQSTSPLVAYDFQQNESTIVVAEQNPGFTASHLVGIRRGNDGQFGTVDDDFAPITSLQSGVTSGGDIPLAHENGTLLFVRQSPIVNGAAKRSLMLLSAGQDRKLGTADDTPPQTLETQVIQTVGPSTVLATFEKASIHDGVVAWMTLIVKTQSSGQTSFIGTLHGCETQLASSSVGACNQARSYTLPLPSNVTSAASVHRIVPQRVQQGAAQLPVAFVSYRIATTGQARSIVYNMSQNSLVVPAIGDRQVVGINSSGGQLITTREVVSPQLSLQSPTLIEVGNFFGPQDWLPLQSGRISIQSVGNELDWNYAITPYVYESQVYGTTRSYYYDLAGWHSPLQIVASDRVGEFSVGGPTVAYIAYAPFNTLMASTCN